MFFPEPKQYIEQENLLLVDESKNLKSSKPLILAKYECKLEEQERNNDSPLR